MISNIKLFKILFVVFLCAVLAENNLIIASQRNDKTGLITIKKLLPVPNYELSTDDDDIRQLTDHDILRFPIWTKKGCVGWHKKTPIKISAKLNSKASSGTLRFHTAKGTYAGVNVLRRVDVYSKQASRGYSHIGEYNGQNLQYGDRRNHWINVAVHNAGVDLEIIVHASGTNIFIDEIEWIPVEENEVPLRIQQTPIEEDQITKDSIARLKTSLIEKSMRSEVEKRKTPLPTVWIDDPWGELSWEPALDNNAVSEGIRVKGYRNEKESAILGLYNAQRDVEYKVTIDSGNKIEPGAVQLGIVESILSANGALIFDPIIPIRLGESFVIESDKVSYLWLTLDLSKFREEKIRFNMALSAANSQISYSIPVSIDIVDKEIVQNQPAAINWSYTSNLPIWNNRSEAVTDLQEHGINVFVVPPQHIPQPNVKGDWDIGAAMRLTKDLELFKGRGQILLIPGWGPGSRPAWIFGSKDLSEQEKFEVFKIWLIKLNRYMEMLGFDNDAWALYPVDEPHGEKLQFLIRIARWIKRINPRIRVYANPSQSRTGFASYSDLKKLDPLIDIWQPSLTFANGEGKRFFSELTRPWWIYNNPRAPAKQASPLSDFRMLAWEAWKIGAKGVGFWSYSDTQGSSAWDDFDGVRADWAVVYENDVRPIASRRWEAFREGVEDYKLLKATEHMSCFPLTTGSSERNALTNRSYTSQSIKQTRIQLLNCLKDNL